MSTNVISLFDYRDPTVTKNSQFDLRFIESAAEHLHLTVEKHVDFNNCASISSFLLAHATSEQIIDTIYNNTNDNFPDRQIIVFLTTRESGFSLEHPYIDRVIKVKDKVRIILFARNTSLLIKDVTILEITLKLTPEDAEAIIYSRGNYPYSGSTPFARGNSFLIAAFILCQGYLFNCENDLNKKEINRDFWSDVLGNQGDIKHRVAQEINLVSTENNCVSKLVNAIDDPSSEISHDLVSEVFRTLHKKFSYLR
jgi:hypothetical protein